METLKSIVKTHIRGLETRLATAKKNIVRDRRDFENSVAYEKLVQEEIDETRRILKEET